MTGAMAMQMDNGVGYRFFTRQGGVSKGVYASLNCGLGSADDPADILENRRRVEASMGGFPLVNVYQVHGDACVTVTEPWTRDAMPKADAMVTDRAGISLGILTADCGPVLVWGAKPDGSPVIGAAHAGWGGALKGILENTVTAITALGATRDSLHAAVGPCIGRQSYEVSAGFETPFVDRDLDAAGFFLPASRAGHRIFDLPGYLGFRLKQAGITRIARCYRDTFAEQDDFFSYRRCTLHRETDYGRQISVIALKI